MGSGQHVTSLEITQMASMKAAGMTDRAIAEAMSRDKITVQRKLKKAEVRALIESTAQEMAAESLQAIKDNHVLCLKQARKIYQRVHDDPNPGVYVDPETGKAKRVESLSDSDKTLLALADKKEYRLGQMMGIFPSHAPSVVVQNIFQAGSQAVILPNVAAALGAAGCAQFEASQGQVEDDLDEDVIDVGE